LEAQALEALGSGFFVTVTVLLETWQAFCKWGTIFDLHVAHHQLPPIYGVTGKWNSLKLPTFEGAQAVFLLTAHHQLPPIYGVTGKWYGLKLPIFESSSLTAADIRRHK
jgi:hypothetical protein